MPSAPDTLTLLKIAASFWHVAAFGVGVTFVVLAYRALFNWQPYDPSWNRILSRADLHLWLSGLAIITVGILSVGAEKYLSNPKLWTKVLVVAVWTLATLLMRARSGLWFRQGKRTRIAVLAGISLACWIYGAVLGVARDLAYGAVPFETLALGFLATVTAAVLASLILEEGRRVDQRAQASGKN